MALLVHEGPSKRFARSVDVQIPPSLSPVEVSTRVSPTTATSPSGDRAAAVIFTRYVGTAQGLVHDSSSKNHQSGSVPSLVTMGGVGCGLGCGLDCGLVPYSCTTSFARKVEPWPGKNSNHVGSARVAAIC